MLRLVTIAVVCTMLLIPIAGFSSHIISNGLLLIAVSFGLSYLVIPAIFLEIWPARHRSSAGIQTIHEALWNGELVTSEYEVRDVAQVEEVEDEGLHFLIEIQTGETLFLSGQYLYSLVERNIFPSERLRVFRNRHSNVCYGIEPVGHPISSWPVYDGFIEEGSQTDLVLENGCLYPRSVSELAEQFNLLPIPPGSGEGQNQGFHEGRQRK